MKPNDAANVAASAGTNGSTFAATATGMMIGTTTAAEAVLLVEQELVSHGDGRFGAEYDHLAILTKIGDDNLLMAQAHVAHDCQIGNEVIMANAATLAGHVEIADRSNIGAYSGVHQFCRIGLEAFVGGYSVIVKDALPFAVSQGNHAKCYGLNRLGMKRRGYAKETVEKLHRAYHLLLSAKLNTTQAVEKIKEEIKDCAEVDLLVDFIETSKRGVVK